MILPGTHGTHPRCSPQGLAQAKRLITWWLSLVQSYFTDGETEVPEAKGVTYEIGG